MAVYITLYNTNKFVTVVPRETDVGSLLSLHPTSEAPCRRKCFQRDHHTPADVLLVVAALATVGMATVAIVPGRWLLSPSVVLTTATQDDNNN